MREKTEVIAMIVIAHIIHKHEHLHNLQPQECTWRARPAKSLFLLQHNLPQSCESATRHYPVGCKFSSCCSKGEKRWRDGRLASLPCFAEAPSGVEGEVERSKPGGDARLSTSTTYQYRYFNENCTSRGVPATDVIAAEPPDAPTTAGTGLLNDG